MGKYANIAQYAVAPYTRAGSSDFLRSCFRGFSAGRYTNTAHDTESSHSKLLFLQARVDGHRPLLSYWQRGYAPNSKSQEVRTYHLNVSRTSRPSHPHLAHLGCYGASFSRTRFSFAPSRLLWCEFFTYTTFSFAPSRLLWCEFFTYTILFRPILVAMVRVFHVHDFLSSHLGCYGASFSRTRFSFAPSWLLWCRFFTYTILSCPISVAMVQVFHVHGAAQLISVAMVRVFHAHGAAQHSSPCNL